MSSKDKSSASGKQRFIFNLDEDQVDRLLQAFAEGKLQEFGIFDLQRLDDNGQWTSIIRSKQAIVEDTNIKK